VPILTPRDRALLRERVKVRIDLTKLVKTLEILTLMTLTLMTLKKLTLTTRPTLMRKI
jgi:hypothetical protein